VFRRPLVLLIWAAACLLIGAAVAISADFPPIEQLPQHPALPDPLTMFDGSPVATRQEWFHKRRPELKALFEYYEYGQAPPPPTNLVGTVLRHDPHCFGGKATLDEVRITFGPPGTPPINLLLVVPHREKSAPVFVALNFCGNHAVLNDPAIAIPTPWMPDSCKGCVKHQATDAGRGAQAANWAIENAIDRGYAIATFYDGDIDPDKNDFTDGVHPHYFAPGQTAPREHDWGTIRAWAWGLSRVVDYLETRPDIDHQRICATGHSRLGKTALVVRTGRRRPGPVSPQHEARIEPGLLDSALRLRGRILRATTLVQIDSEQDPLGEPGA
jgi:hypothetical protein